MCLAIPGRVLNVEGDDPAMLAGKVDFGGIRKEVRFAFTPDVKPGDYVLVHVGFALRVVDEEEAERSRDAIAELLREASSEAPATAPQSLPP